MKVKDSFCLIALTLLSVSQPTAIAVTVHDLYEKKLDSVKEEKPTLTLTKTQSMALQLLEQGKLKEASELLKKSISKTKEIDPELAYLLSLFQWKEEQYKDCAKSLQTVLDSTRYKNTKDPRKKILLLKRIGDCYYQIRALDKSTEFYKESLKLSESLPADDKLKVGLLENLIGTQIYEKKFADAEIYAKQLLSLTSKRSESNNIEDIASNLWAQLQLLYIYRTQGKEEERKELAKQKTNELLDKLVTLRADLDEAGKIPSVEVFKNLFLNDYIKQNKPSTLAEYLWLANEYKPHSLPLIEWRNQQGSTPKAIILCIHGLGLDNTAYGPFGHAMTKRGFSVYAMDVRGFGSWLTIPGQEDVGFTDALKDIKAVVAVIKERHPNIPIYLLGESMGGGIALRAGAKFGKLVNGIIASVPSAERFQGKRMGLNVAAHFLKDADRPFNIGHTVATQATTNEALQDAWEESYKAKMKMTPVELMKFALFMRTTQFHCKDITETPVFIVQGLKDRLVKPEGTYKMFDAINSQDKTMVIVGTAEHLIFENDDQSPILLSTLTEWLDQHSKDNTQ